MADRFRRSRGPQRRRPVRDSRRPAKRRRAFEDDLSDEWDDREEPEDDYDDEDEYDEPPRRSARPAPSRRRPPERHREARERPPKRRARGGSRRGGERDGGGFDWSAAEDDLDYGADEDRYDEEGYEDEYEEPRARKPRRPRRPAARREKKKKKKSLVDICTPIFGYASLLPRQAGGAQPGYQQFRQEVVGSLQRIESDADQNGVDPEDARQAAYALALFIDEEVAQSEWVGKSQWSSEPLSINLLGDPEGGINFFKRLEALTDRQKDAKSIFLICIGLGFRGKYVELEPNQQVARLGEIKEEALRTIQRLPMDRRDMLFPEAYRPANTIEDELPPTPRWWLWASLGALGLMAVLWLALFFTAGGRAGEATTTLGKIQPFEDRGASSTLEESTEAFPGGTEEDTP